MLQFPRTRDVLWDHEETGPAIVLQLHKRRKPEVLVPQQVLRLACRQCETECQHGFRGFLSASVLVQQDGSGLCVQVDRLDLRPPGAHSHAVPGDIVIPMEFSFNDKKERGASAEDHKKIMESAYSKLSGALELSDICECLGWCSFYGNKEKSVAHLQMNLVTLSSSFRVVPVSPVPIVPTGLSKNLAGPSGLSQVQGTPKTGYLTMNETRNLIVVFDTEPQIANLLIVGIWVSGVALVDHPFVWAACSRYMHTGVLRNRECCSPFLLVLYSPLHRGPEFYDCYPSETEQSASPTIFSLLGGYEATHFSKCGSTQQCFVNVQLSPILSGPHAAQFLSAQNVFQKSKKLAFPKKPEAFQSIPDDIVPRSTPAPYKAQRETVKPMVPEVSIYFGDGCPQGSPSEWEESPQSQVPGYNKAPASHYQAELGTARGCLPENSVPQARPSRASSGFHVAVPVFTPSTARTLQPQLSSMPGSASQVPLSAMYLPQGAGGPPYPSGSGPASGSSASGLSSPPLPPGGPASAGTLQAGSHGLHMSAPAAPRVAANGPVMSLEGRRCSSEAHVPAGVGGGGPQFYGQQFHPGSQVHHGAHQAVMGSQLGYSGVQTPHSNFAPCPPGGLAAAGAPRSNSLPSWGAGPSVQNAGRQPPCSCCPHPPHPGPVRNFAPPFSQPHPPGPYCVSSSAQSSAPSHPCRTGSAVPFQRPPGGFGGQMHPMPAPLPHPYPHPQPPIRQHLGSQSTGPGQSSAPVCNSYPEQNVPPISPASDSAFPCANVPSSSSGVTHADGQLPGHRVAAPLHVSFVDGPLHGNSTQSRQAESVHSGKSSDDSGLSVTPEHLNPSPKCESPHTDRSPHLDQSSKESLSLSSVDWDKVPPEISQILIQQALQLQQLQSQIHQLLKLQPAGSPPSLQQPTPQRVDSACNTSFYYADRVAGSVEATPKQSVSLQTSPQKRVEESEVRHMSPQKCSRSTQDLGQGQMPVATPGQTPLEIRHCGVLPLESTQREEWEATPGDLTAVMSQLGVCEQTVDTFQSDLVVDMPSFQASSSTRSHSSHADGSGDASDTSPIVSASMYGQQDTSTEEEERDRQELQASDDINFDAVLANVRQFLEKHRSIDGEESPGILHESSEADADKSSLQTLVKNGHTAPTDTSFYPRIEYMSMLLDSDSNLSADIDAMALKYLPDEALTRVMQLQQQQQRSSQGSQLSLQSRNNLLRRMLMADQSGAVDVSYLGLSPNNITMGTKEYLEKYGLLGGGADDAVGENTLADESFRLKLDFSVMAPEDTQLSSPDRGYLSRRPPATPQQGRSQPPVVTTPQGFACSSGAAPVLETSAPPVTPTHPGPQRSCPLRERVNGVFTPSPVRHPQGPWGTGGAPASPQKLPPPVELSAPNSCSGQSSDSEPSSQDSSSRRPGAQQQGGGNLQWAHRENRVDENDDRILDIHKLKQLPKFL